MEKRKVIIIEAGTDVKALAIAIAQAELQEVFIITSEPPVQTIVDYIEEIKIDYAVYNYKEEYYKVDIPDKSKKNKPKLNFKPQHLKNNNQKLRNFRSKFILYKF